MMQLYWLCNMCGERHLMCVFDQDVVVPLSFLKKHRSCGWADPQRSDEHRGYFNVLVLASAEELDR